jgi:hypothetical protein
VANFKKSLLLVLVWGLVLALGCGDRREPQATLTGTLSDEFTDGKASLNWVAYDYFNRDNLLASVDSSTPTEDKGVGVLNNDNAGGFAALSYARDTKLSDFDLDVWLRVEVSGKEKGPLNGIAFRVDAEEGNFYRVATHFNEAEPKITLSFVGESTNNFPEVVTTWDKNEIPGGLPQRTGWHKLRILASGDEARVWWNDKPLSGKPSKINRLEEGYVGVYANFVGGLGKAETRIDDLRVRFSAEGLDFVKVRTPKVPQKKIACGDITVNCH